MEKNCKAVLGTVFLIFLFASLLWASSDWKQVKNKKGIKILTRPVEGYTLDEFKAECMVDAPMEVVYEIMRDTDSYPNWFGNCQSYKTLKVIDEYNELAYQVTGLPFPLADRDMVAIMKFSSDWDSGKATLTILPESEYSDIRYDTGEITKGKRRVRMKKLQGQVTAMRVTPEETRIVFQGHADPGLPLPGRVLNKLSSGLPYRTLMGLKEELNKKKYYERAENRHHKKFTALN